MRKKLADSFYNKNIKDSFLRTGSKQSSIIALFGAFASTEERLGKDLYEFTSDEVKAVLDSYVGTASTYDLAIKNLKRYINWNLAENRHPLMSPGDLDGISYEPYEKLRREMVVSAANLSDVLLDAFGKPLSGTQNSLYRCYVWLIFIGYSGFEATRIQSEHIDFVTKTIRFAPRGESEGSVVKVASFPDEATADLAEACSMKFVLTGTVDKHNDHEVPRSTSSRVLRLWNNGNKAFDDSYYQINCARVLRAAGRAETLNSIARSGQFLRFYQDEQVGKKIDYLGITKETMIGQRPSYVRRFAQYLETDYKNWKAAFNL